MPLNIRKGLVTTLGTHVRILWGWVVASLLIYTLALGAAALDDYGPEATPVIIIVTASGPFKGI